MEKGSNIRTIFSPSFSLPSRVVSNHHLTFCLLEELVTLKNLLLLPFSIGRYLPKCTIYSCLSRPTEKKPMQCYQQMPVPVHPGIHSFDESSTFVTSLRPLPRSSSHRNNRTTTNGNRIGRIPEVLCNFSKGEPGYL